MTNQLKIKYYLYLKYLELSLIYLYIDLFFRILILNIQNIGKLSLLSINKIQLCLRQLSKLVNISIIDYNY